EFASIWRSFGSNVRIVEALPRLLPSEDEEVSKAIQRAFRKRGIAFDLGSRVASVETGATGVTVTLENGKSAQAEIVLVAVGRGPVTNQEELDRAGIKTSGGCVDTDDHLQTTTPGVYAVGDIVAGLQLAHRGFQHGIFVAEHIGGLQPDLIDDNA